MEGIRRVLVLGLVLIAGTAIEEAPSVGPLLTLFFRVIKPHSSICLHIFWHFYRISDDYPGMYE